MNDAEQSKILETMVEAARKAVTGFPHTQTLSFQMRAALTALEEAGYCVMPKEATDEMIEAGTRAETDCFTPVWDIYTAMVKATL